MHCKLMLPKMLIWTLQVTVICSASMQLCTSPCHVSPLLAFIQLRVVTLNLIGITELRSSIAKLHKHFDNLTFSKDDVIVGPGSKELIYLVLSVCDGG